LTKVSLTDKNVCVTMMVIDVVLTEAVAAEKEQIRSGEWRGTSWQWI
jgi:hypothetical protein